MVEDLGIRISAFFAFGACLTSAILMLAFPMFGAYWGYGIYVYIVAGAGDQGSLIIVAAVFMILCSLMALATIAIPERLKKMYMIPGVILPYIVFILGLAGLGMAYDGFSGKEWWPETGFFGSVIPSLIAALVFLGIYRMMRRRE
ncbi:MAG: hypothetical protein KAX18_12440 [Candidatus Lokiarchaeota archaeon]|nr:hypothetical protein [Candidatus Lokiarchaeota archaeon]